MPPGKNRDPHYMTVKNGNMLSLHGKADNQVPEDDKRFNPATMGNRIFKTLPKRASKNPKGMKMGSAKGHKAGGSSIARAAARRLKGIM